MDNIINSFAAVDWVIILSYLVVTIGIGLYFTKRASSNITDYFVSGRNLPWWLLGTSMVATTFAADTPLVITGWVRTEGIWKNWFWWNYIFGHVLAVFLFSRLWRRAEVLTDNEFIELRYSGKPAAFLRGFKALYFSTLFNFIVMGWVISAMAKVFSVFFGVDTYAAVVVCLVIAVTYTALSGIWGVAITDFLQYIIAIIGSVILVHFVISSPDIGGYSGFLSRLGEVESNIKFFMTPETGTPVSDGFFSSSFFSFLVFISVIWWSSHNADGGGYIIQRMSSAKNENHAVAGTAWFVINHYIIRLWPWVLVAVASLLIFPYAEHKDADQEIYYLLMIKKYLGPGLQGLLFVTFLAAFMSTITTHLNWGSSYLVNDIYKRFIDKNGSDRRYVLVSRIFTIIITILAGIFALYIKNIGKAWIFLWAMSAGIGLVLILRWFWWRINAWSEISALASSIITILAMILYTNLKGITLELKHQVIVIPISITTWVITTYLTAPEPTQKLQFFYNKIRPWGFWGPVTTSNENKEPLAALLLNWVLGICVVISGMVGVGKLLLGQFGLGFILFVISIICSFILYYRIFKIK
ncbi:MAG: sodium:proline symporter [Candidatus Dadabacteria bacterium]|nr:sodium:proline symporter [Candidatus Dadabacteria bacterium]